MAFHPFSHERQVTLGVSVKTLWRMRTAGDFPAPLTIGRRSKRWRQETVEAYIQKQEGGR
ncbi:helix-turn-helix transcriptional regulator [Aureimonas sp. AU40]|uniref:helix-turn-helix transcriptional regulator n=1 Tax=Aureimonas sp. AU40 TaxID=1637747 RepID=UPI0007841FC1